MSLIEPQYSVSFLKARFSEIRQNITEIEQKQKDIFWKPREVKSNVPKENKENDQTQYFQRMLRIAEKERENLALQLQQVTQEKDDLAVELNKVRYTKMTQNLEIKNLKSELASLKSRETPSIIKSTANIPKKTHSTA